MTVAVSACRSAGYNVSDALARGESVANYPKPQMVYDVSTCAEGATSLANCTLTPVSSCPSQEYVILDCRGPQHPGWNVSVVASPGESSDSVKRGTLIVTPKINGTMRAPVSVCSVLFDDYDAKLACRSAGYNVSAAFALLNWGAAEGVDARIGNVGCDAAAKTLLSCLFTLTDAPNPPCKNWAAVGVDCSGTPRPPEPVLLFIATMPAAATTTFANNLATMLITVPSRIVVVGMVTNASQWSNVTFHFTAANTSSPDFALRRSRADLQQNLLASSPMQLNHYTEMVALFSNSSALVRGTMQFRIVPVSAARPAVGVLEFRPSMNAGWGSVCNEGFDANAARAVCSQMGYANAASAAKMVPLNLIGRTSGDPGPIYVHRTSCPPNASSFAACAFEYSEIGNPISVCTHNQDVAVDCNATNNQWSFRVNSTGYTFGGGRVGTLHVLSEYGLWGVSCGTYDDTAATAICARAGFDTPSGRMFYAFEYTTHALTDMPYTMSSASCTTAGNCAFSDVDVQRCYPYLAVLGIDCRNLTTMQLRIQPGSSINPNRGLVQIRFNQSDSWGTACSAGFDNQAAVSACRTMGLNATGAYSLPYWGGGTGTVYVSNTLCQNGEPFADCNFDSYPKYCGHYDDVGIDCTNVPRPPAPILQWTGVPQNGSTASAMMSRLSFYIGVPMTRFNIQTLADNLVTWIYTDATNTSSTSRANLDQQTSLFSAYEYDVIGLASLYSNSSNLIRNTLRIRIGVMPNTLAGIVYIKPSASEDWGTICAHPGGTAKDSAAVAGAVCGSLGLAAGVVIPSPSNFSALPGPIYLHRLNCTGTTTFSQCAFQYSEAENPMSQCSHVSDLAVSCSAAPVSVSSWQFKMLPSAGGPAIGTLVARPDVSVPYQGFCGPFASGLAAKAICNQLGFVGSVGRFVIGSPSPAAIGMWPATGITCVSANLSTCTIANGHALSPSCDRYSEVTLDCRNLSTLAARLDPIDGSAVRGRLNVRFNATSAWGTVCTDGFSDGAALAACRTAGFNVSTAYSLGWWGGGSGPIYMSNVFCPPGADGSLQQCDFITLPTTCEHWEDVAVDCSGHARPQLPTVAFTATVNNVTTAFLELEDLLGVDPSQVQVVTTTSSGTNTVVTWVFTTPTSTSQRARSDIENDVLEMDSDELAAVGFLNVTSNVSSAVQSTITVTLLGNATSSAGIVAVRPASNYGLGTVCGGIGGLSPDDASAICRSMGFSGGVATSAAPFSATVSGPVFLSNLKCPPSASGLRACRFTFSTPDAPRSLCTHADDVAVNCTSSSPVTPPSTTTPISTPTRAATTTIAPPISTPASTQTSPAASITPPPTSNPTRTAAPPNTPTPDSKKFTAKVQDAATFNVTQFSLDFATALHVPAQDVRVVLIDGEVQITVYGASAINAATSLPPAALSQLGIGPLQASAPESSGGGPPTGPSSATMLAVALGCAGGLVVIVVVIAVFTLRHRQKTHWARDWHNDTGR
jgi:hypothetical protein